MGEQREPASRSRRYGIVPDMRKVVRAGNIGEFSLLLWQCGKALILQGGAIREDDVGNTK